MRLVICDNLTLWCDVLAECRGQNMSMDKLRMVKQHLPTSKFLAILVLDFRNSPHTSPSSYTFP